MIHFKVIRTLTIVCALLFIGSSSTQAGLSGSVGYDFLPYQDIDEPIILNDSTNIDNAQVKLSKLKATLSYPMIYSQGRTILMNELSYQNLEFKYRNTESILKRLHRVSYTLTMIRSMSDKWSLIAMANPSIASDFESGLTTEDLSFQTAVIAKKQYSQKLAIGYGFAYSTQFGSAIPLPLLMIEWDNGNKWSISSVLPSNMEVWYQASEKVTLGMLVTSDGDNYYFDPQGYQVDRPELRYTMLTIGPSAKISLSKKMQLNIEGGIIGLHRFEFYDGDNEVVSNDLKPSQYVRLGLQTDF